MGTVAEIESVKEVPELEDPAPAVVLPEDEVLCSAEVELGRGLSLLAIKEHPELKALMRMTIPAGTSFDRILLDRHFIPFPLYRQVGSLATLATM